MEMTSELQESKTERKGSGLKGLVLFSIISFVVCFAGIYALSVERRKTKAAENLEESSTGYFDGYTYINKDLGWELDFPEGMTILDYGQLQAWKYLPQIPGFETDSEAHSRLFLALGESFSVVAFARLELLFDLPFWLTREQIMSEEQEKIRQSIIGNNPAFECNFEVNDVVIDKVPFKSLSVVFIHDGEEQKRQVIFTTLFENLLLNVTVVYHNPFRGEQIIAALRNSSFSE
jgi:hypothetical protein